MDAPRTSVKATSPKTRATAPTTKRSSPAFVLNGLVKAKSPLVNASVQVSQAHGCQAPENAATSVSASHNGDPEASRTHAPGGSAASLFHPPQASTSVSSALSSPTFTPDLNDPKISLVKGQSLPVLHSTNAPISTSFLPSLLSQSHIRTSLVSSAQSVMLSNQLLAASASLITKPSLSNQSASAPPPTSFRTSAYSHSRPASSAMARMGPSPIMSTGLSFFSSQRSATVTPPPTRPSSQSSGVQVTESQKVVVTSTSLASKVLPDSLNVKSPSKESSTFPNDSATSDPSLSGLTSKLNTKAYESSFEVAVTSCAQSVTADEVQRTSPMQLTSHEGFLLSTIVMSDRTPPTPVINPTVEATRKLSPTIQDDSLDSKSKDQLLVNSEFVRSESGGSASTASNRETPPAVEEVSEATSACELRFTAMNEHSYSALASTLTSHSLATRRRASTVEDKLVGSEIQEQIQPDETQSDDSIIEESVLDDSLLDMTLIESDAQEAETAPEVTSPITPNTVLISTSCSESKIVETKNFSLDLRSAVTAQSPMFIRSDATNVKEWRMAQSRKVVEVTAKSQQYVFNSATSSTNSEVSSRQDFEPALESNSVEEAVNLQSSNNSIPELLNESSNLSADELRSGKTSLAVNTAASSRTSSTSAGVVSLSSDESSDAVSEVTSRFRHESGNSALKFDGSTTDHRTPARRSSPFNALVSAVPPLKTVRNRRKNNNLDSHEVHDIPLTDGRATRSSKRKVPPERDVFVNSEVKKARSQEACVTELSGVHDGSDATLTRAASLEPDFLKTPTRPKNTRSKSALSNDVSNSVPGEILVANTSEYSTSYMPCFSSSLITPCTCKQKLKTYPFLLCFRPCRRSLRIYQINTVPKTSR